MRLARYTETVESDEGDLYDVFTIAVPRATTTALGAADLTNPTGVTPALARAVAVPIAAEAQRVKAQGKS